MAGETVDRKEVLKQAFVKALPITGSYLFVSMAYGLTMQEAGLSWFWSLFTSLTVYTGAFQFVLVTFLSSGASILTIALTALFMNSRQFFYGLTFVEDFKKMGKRYPYMVHTMTDETYAVNCSMLSSEVIRDRTQRRKMTGSADLILCFMWHYSVVYPGWWALCLAAYSVRSFR